LPGPVQVDHRAGPDAGIAGIGDENAIRGQGARHLGAEPLDRNRRRVLFAERYHAGAPIADDPRRLIGETAIADRGTTISADDLDEPSNACFRVADNAGRIRIAAPDFQGIGLDLHDRRLIGWDGPV
jgi:hypothetical protein